MLGAAAKKRQQPSRRYANTRARPFICIYQLNEVIGSDKLVSLGRKNCSKLQGVLGRSSPFEGSIISPRKDLNARPDVVSYRFRHHTSHGWMQLIELEEGVEVNTSPIITPILLALKMHIRPTAFLGNGAPEVV